MQTVISRHLIVLINLAPLIGGRQSHYQFTLTVITTPLILSRWLSGKTLDCRPRDCEFDPPSLQLKLLKKGDMYWFFPGKMLRCISALHWVR